MILGAKKRGLIHGVSLEADPEYNILALGFTPKVCRTRFFENRDHDVKISRQGCGVAE
jgi:hypothetical protein